MTAAAIDPRFALASVGKTSVGKSPVGKLLSGRPRPAWGNDVLALPARLLFELPIPPRLGLHVPGVEGIVRIGVDAAICFDAEEWGALVVATEADRLWPRDFELFCRRKAESGDRLESDEALSGAQADLAEEWTVGRVIDRLGVELLSVDLD